MSAAAEALECSTRVLEIAGWDISTFSSTVTIPPQSVPRQSVSSSVIRGAGAVGDEQAAIGEFFQNQVEQLRLEPLLSAAAFAHAVPAEKEHGDPVQFEKGCQAVLTITQDLDFLRRLGYDAPTLFEQNGLPVDVLPLCLVELRKPGLDRFTDRARPLRKIVHGGNEAIPDQKALGISA